MRTGGEHGHCLWGTLGGSWICLVQGQNNLFFKGRNLKKQRVDKDVRFVLLTSLDRPML